MPRLTRSVPRYRKHKATDQAVVTIAGRDYYLGPYGSKASKIEYDRRIGEWLAAGRPTTSAEPEALTINELIRRYWSFATGHYRKQGKGTSELGNIRYALKPLRQLYGKTSVCEFGPLSLKSLQRRMIEDGLSRGVINSRIGKIKRMFRWAVSEELAPGSMMHALEAVTGLQKGRTDARETAPIKPVDEETVDATLPHLPSVVADMVCLQRLTGMRPQDVCNLRPVDVDRREDVWLYRPATHKTEHHGKDRVVCLGPRAQEILAPYLLRSADSHCFSPADSERKRKADMRANRKSKVQPSQRDRSKRHPQRPPGDGYTTQSYLSAVHRACDRAFPPSPPLAKDEGETIAQWKERLTKHQAEELKRWQKEHRWSPNQLRHSTGTKVREQFGLEAAQVVLGHSKADTTEIYAERDINTAMNVARLVG